MTASSYHLQIRRRLNRKSRMGLVLKYLTQNDYNPNDEVVRMMEARFYPLALSSEGKLSRSIANDCISTLQGYISAIENLVEVHSNSRTKNNAEFLELDEEDDVDDVDDVQSKLEFTEQMFGM